MRAFVLMLVALLLIILLAPVVLLIQTIRYPLLGRPLTQLWWDTALGLDQLGGAILYGEPDWTISSRTYWLARRGNRYAAMFERLIDALFGQGHCVGSYVSEFGNTIAQKEVKEA